ncbi:multifunctional oxoglutarate decarboxylase/oxoglutarate dehydrogenase thiamine pyrophosphate-binding subunit/dihydrolipoyllysine-residue succinyltransferase subunit [Buchananella hordeovulneris]|uniref:multifunctional oxoglutarate decarboxylase/oxoglutarate dehydrogenase thiamine pyrophosphate-binding subunit/dihydrolipoyllysine-residue succinyltransferase subunit n=1 Tax=Buchananella hordeovulneris TaxID=52770 RepID=UPI000A7AB27D|nr:multifunctional oxoglutarate decarboxylase/oxoglutarate dehydrogenase thiamine pyrophosphate-binding subunit/dihydrolipoyllysine-residue succinyltransferase subunit [Buchananella hordeovulneris]
MADSLDFGANEWLIEEIRERYAADPASVPAAWRAYFEADDSTPTAGAALASFVAATPETAAPAPAQPSAPSGEAPAPASSATPAPSPQATPSSAAPAPVPPPAPRGVAPAPAPEPDQFAQQAAAPADATRSDLPPAPPVAIAPPTSPYAARRHLTRLPVAANQVEEDTTTRLRGAASRIVTNMEESLSVPTATSVRTVPAKLLIENRALINEYLSRTRGGKVSFTHLIAYAMVEALVEMPSMNVAYQVVDGKPALVEFAHVAFGLAIDLPRPDGTRQLLVPAVKDADELTFAEFVAAYEQVVQRTRRGELTAADFGATCTLTNPGTLGTVHSVPRLMAGQGVIVGVGSMDYPAEFAGASAQALARGAIGRTLTLTSTYDHRVIQGAGSGEFLRLIHRKLTGEDGFYSRVFTSLRIPYEVLTWVQDVEYDAELEKDKPARIVELIHAYRSRGHLAADTDPLSYRVRRHPDLDMTNYGLTIWDLDREFATGSFGSAPHMKLRDILSQLRETYTRSIGIEYMHIQDPAQRRWMQDRIEGPYVPLAPQVQRRALKMLGQAEAFEVFLQTKFVGQKRFSLEGGESLIPLLDRLLDEAAHEGLDEVAIGMAHRGRLNVLANIAGKSYAQIFSEFESGVTVTNAGSGDVKYHLGTEGTFTGTDGATTRVYLAANPSHLEAVNGVLEGVVRAKQDRLATGDFSVMPVLIHGDSAFAGQGVVYEVLNMSQLDAYRTGGTVHVIVNNQIGFTTGPTSARSTNYCTDLAKGLQVPIMHVNGDDVEAVARAAQLAFAYRNEFHKDVIIDLTCYRRRGHNEGDDPSMTQPVMYSVIDAKDGVRETFTRALVGRGELSESEAQALVDDFNSELEKILSATKEHGWQAEAEAVAGLERPESQRLGSGMMIGWTTAIDRDVIERIGQAHMRVPADFALHPKLAQLCERREKMSREGGIDWGFAELLAFGSLLVEGTPVRMSGQDSRRGTFVQRHAVLHDHLNGREWTPLHFITENQADFSIYDSSLSEYAPLAFEYGYSVEMPEALVLWEAQFGDFANGAQTVIDEFISSSEQKWNQRSSVAVLLPHGYEGQGPDHSSARIERYLTLAAEDNMTICQPSTPANHFHMLRRQAYVRPRRPLIAFTPKQLLRLRAATSAVEDFTSGTFQPVLGEVNQTVAAQANQVTRVLLCSGRIYYDLAAERERLGRTDVAIVRLEQLYPLPVPQLQDALAPFSRAELVWVQDEPANQGPLPYMLRHLPSLLGRDGLPFISRKEAASPSAGNMARHREENAEILRTSFA